MTEATEKETRGFQTEVRQLLDLMVHSLYSNKEIFLRELISNSSDACDKLRFEALSDDGLYEGDGELKIQVDYDSTARTITVRDNGIGMSREEVVDNLGTIAKSGTQQFFEALTGDAARDAELIGQFGVGFYSSFIVADKVTVTSRRADLGREDGVRWESAGEGEFTVENIPVPKRGTRVVLHLKENEEEFLDGYRLRSIVTRYSDHISFPISMPKEGEDATGEETVNKATALWVRNRSEIEDEEYNEFYRHVAHEFDEPLARVHSRVEGNLEYTALLFIPSRAPFDLWDRNVRRGINLYVRRVFIMDDAENLMPPYLRFVRGVVDCADLPLNVSRELLQKNKQIDAVRSGCVRRVLDLLTSLAKNESDKYATFWSHFGQVLKEGIIDDAKNRDAIAKLSRFASTHEDGEEQRVTLDDYVGRMKSGQEKIFYVTADNYTTALNSPHLEAFKANGIEVLLLSDHVDEWMVHHLGEYDGKVLQSVSKGEFDLSHIGDGDRNAEDDEEKTPAAKDEGESGTDSGDSDSGDGDTDDALPETHAALVAKVKAGLEDRVKDVRITRRLTDSPACLVADEHEMGAHMERLLRAAGQPVSGTKPILEINPEHFIARHLGVEMEDGEVRDWAELLYDQALLSEGGKLEDPAGFVRRLNRMFSSLGSD